MNEEQFKYNVHFLENINGAVALVDANKFEYLHEDTWIPISDFDIPYIPIIIYTFQNIKEDMSQISYTLEYEMLLPHLKIIPKYHERVIISACKEGRQPLKKIYKKDKNHDYYEESLVRYNNEKSNTFSSIKNNITINEYKEKHKRKLHEIAANINISLDKKKIKELK